MKINMPNKALSHKILCGAAVLVFFLAACDAVPAQAYSSINDWPSIKKEYERGLAIGIARSKKAARSAALALIPKGGTVYGDAVYIKHENNTYTCYLKWKWSLEDVTLPAK